MGLILKTTKVKVISGVLLCVFITGCSQDNFESNNSPTRETIANDLQEQVHRQTLTRQEDEARKADIQLIIEKQKARAMAKKNSIPPPDGDPHIWIMDAQSVYGEYADPSTVFLVTDEGNCGGKGGGCAVYSENPDGPVTLYISPTGIGDTQLLFHEIAHSKGIMDECMADKWAHTVTDIEEWKYPECAG